MTDRTPILVVGDGPAEPTGLGRIARDLSALLAEMPEVDLVQLGGMVPPVWGPWRHVPLDRADDWGAACTTEVYRSIWGTQPGVLFGVWDPSRLYSYLSLDLPVERWGYMAVDAHNIHEQVSGPAAAVVQQFDRILAYGRYGAKILGKTRGAPVGSLPHGLLLSVFQAPATDTEQEEVRSILGRFYRGQPLVGSVMSNQPRKDFGIFFQTLAELRRRGRKIYGWLHTDVPVKAWAVAQLVEDFQLQKAVSITTGTLSDRQLACLYQACSLTLACGSGEGFGYPIVESLAAGTPVVHGDYAGGAELVPRTEWRVPVKATRLESCYALTRPVFDPVDWANAAERVFRWQTQYGSVARLYCQGSVAHLDWATLGVRWRSWIRKGLRGG